MEPKAKSFGDLIAAEGSSLALTTLSGSASNCIRLIKLYLFLLTSEKGIRMCWNGDLKKEKVLGSDGVKMTEVLEDRLYPNVPLYGCKTEGASDSHEFVITSGQGEKTSMKRVNVYQQVIPSEESTNISSVLDPYELYPSGDHELYSMVFSIQDPRISIGRGIQRLIAINAEAQQKADKEGNVR
jgi:hypothetical protein